MDAHFLFSEMCADDCGFLDQHQQMNLINDFSDKCIDDKDLDLRLLKDTNDETSFSNWSLEMHGKQSRSREASIKSQMSSMVSNGAKMEFSLELPSPFPLLLSNHSTVPSRQDAAEKRKSPTHVLAERMRRERLSERLIALSALIPGLKKNDKASVLYEAINYVKRLQQRVNVLEEENKKLSTGAHAAAVFFKNSSKELSVPDEHVSDISSKSGNSNCNQGVFYAPIPEVEAKVLGKHVIIRIHCRKHEQVLMNVLREVNNCHLDAVISNVVPFGDSFVDITMVAQMEKEDRKVVNILAKNLGFALSRLE